MSATWHAHPILVLIAPITSMLFIYNFLWFRRAIHWTFYSIVKALKSNCLMNWNNSSDSKNYAYCLGKYFYKRSLEISKILWKFQIFVLWRQNSCYGMLFFRFFTRRYRMSVSADNWFHRCNRRTRYVILHRCNLVSLRIKRSLYYPLWNVFPYVVHEWLRTVE
jgi:hypothetical protein